MSHPTPTVRSLRCALAEALASMSGDHGTPRLTEALDELDRALREDGAEPSAGEIHLLAGRILEAAGDSGRSLQRYLGALGTERAEEAARAARALLRRADTTATALAPDAMVEQALAAVGDGASTEVRLLAAELLRLVHRPAEALAVLGPPPGAEAEAFDVLVLKADLLVDLDQTDQALDLLAAADTRAEAATAGASQAALGVIRARALLLRQDFGQAREVARAARSASDLPMASVMEAMAELGLGDADRSLAALPGTDDADVLMARTVVQLALWDYPAARGSSLVLMRVRPNDPDALLLRAQTVLEGIGGYQPTEPDEARNSGDDLTLARQLLDEVGADAAVGWVWLVQDRVRADDPRYLFFQIERKIAAGQPVSVEDLRAADRSRTTFMQDGVLDERHAKLMIGAGDPIAGAAASSDASDNFQRAGEAGRAYEMALSACEVGPTAAHAASLGYRALDLYRAEQDTDESAGILRVAIEQVRRWFLEAESHELENLVYVNGWMVGTLVDLTVTDRVAAARQAVLPVMAGLVVRPEDAPLWAMLAQLLGTIGEWRAAVEHADSAFALDQTEPYVVEIAISATANYYGQPLAVQRYLARHAQIGERADWRNGIEFAVEVMAGNREAAERLLDTAMPAEDWVTRMRAYCTALQRGLPGARLLMKEALDASLANRPPAYLSAALIITLLGENDRASHYLTEAVAAGNALPREIELARQLLRVVLEPEIPLPELVEAAFAACLSPQEVLSALNVEIPLLAAVRSGSPGSVPDVTDAVVPAQRRLAQIEAEENHWLERLDEASPGAVTLSRLIDTQRAGAIEPLAGADRDEFDDPLLGAAVERLAGVVSQRGWVRFPTHLMLWVVGRGGSGDAEQMRRIVQEAADREPELRLALATVGHRLGHDLWAQLPDPLDDDIVAGAAAIIGAAVTEAELDVDEWWLLDDDLQLAAAAAPAAGRVVSRLRTPMLDSLATILALNRDIPEEYFSHFSIVLGGDFVPADTGSDWVLLSDLIPTLRSRILAATGVEMPGCRVRADPHHRDTVWVLLNGAPLVVHRLPTSGVVRPARAGERAVLTDPLTGAGLVVDDGATPQSGPDSGWSPLGFAMRHVERFVRENLGGMVSLKNLDDVLRGVDEDAAATVMSDPAAVMRSLDRLRAAASTATWADPSTHRQVMEDGLAVARRPAPVPAADRELANMEER